MKKQIIYFALASFALFTVSCSGAEDSKETQEDTHEESTTEEVVEAAPTFEEVCTSETNVFLQVENYEYGLTEPFTHNGTFEVKRSQWVVLNDSTAELKLYNYDLGEETENNLEIYVKLNAKNGNTLQAENYAYQDWDKDYWSKVNVIAPQGTVWFNWVAGMPDQGLIQIDYWDNDHVCGKFMLEVNQADNTTIGHVVLNGTFNH